MSFCPRTIALYSVGLLGGSLGLALKNSGYKGKITGLSSPSNIETALKLGCIDEGFGYEHLQEVVNNCDLLILCSPIQTILRTIERLSTLNLPENLCITDVGSTKKTIVSFAKSKLPSHVKFIGGHPMAGSEKSGPAFSDPYLFQNAIYVITSVDEQPEPLEREFAAFLEKFLGCRTLFLNPSVHDRIAATVSHVPHLLAVALVCLAGEIEQKIPGTLTLAAGGFRDMTRIASAPYDMWHDILLTNKDSIEPLLDSFIDLLTDIKSQMRSDSLKSRFEESRRIRSGISPGNKGFLHPLSEITVHAKDQPGFIASLTGLLAEHNINIKDIEVIKVREGEGGTIRLAFETPATAKNAVGLLAEKGFISRERM